MSNRSNKVSRIGVATLYGRLATNVKVSSPLKSGRFSGETVNASRLITRKRSTASGMNSAMVFGRRSANDGSISTAVIDAPVSRIAKVSEPRPGPTSST